MESKKQIVNLMIDGFGLSTRWQGNAIQAAEPSNFNHYWKSYRHMILQNTVSEGDNLFESYSLISSGKKDNFTAEKVDLDDLQANATFVAALDACKRNNGTIHIVVLVSGDNSKIIKQLHKIYSYTKRFLIADTLVHLIFDETFDSQVSLKEKIFPVIEDINNLQTIQIATCVGLSTIIKDPVNSIKGMFYGGRKQYLSPNQLFISNKNLGLKEIAVSSIKMKSVRKIGDFDTLVFLGESSNAYSSAIRDLVSLIKNKNLPNKPMNLSYFSYTDSPFDLPSEVKFISNRDTNSFISTKLSQQNKKQLLICDNQNLPHLKYYYLGDVCNTDIKVVPIDVDPVSKGVKSTTKSILSHALGEIEARKYDFITINLSSLFRFSVLKSFSDCVSEVRLIDKYLPLLKDALKDDYFIITSVFGGAESMVATDSKISHNGESKQTDMLPFVLISNETRTSNSTELFHEIVRSKNNLTFVYKVLEKII